MASDSRYMYYTPQEVQGSHPYPYPSYEAPPQYPPAQPRNVRNNVPQSASSQPPPAYPPPPNGYAHPTAYAPQAYGAPPPPPPAHWAPPETWQHFPQQFVQPNPPIQESAPYASDARSEVQTQPSPEQRAPADNAPRPASTQPSNNDVQMSPPSSLAPQPKPRTAREPPQAAPLAPELPSMPISLPLDFVKLMDSYRLVIDSANAFAADTGQARHASVTEDLERMLQAAALGAQALDAAVKRVAEVPPAPPSNDQPPPPDEGDGSGGKSRQTLRRKADNTAWAATLHRHQNGGEDH
ncbi:hypothetical protein EIP86_009792 [Pleurotus ostreatoroseus]|nr:hypothetical protein EIP86_009792 [Pleurotus ostreatoroseus]